MSLTAARGPLGKDPAGRLTFTPDSPTGSVLLWDPVPYRLRAFLVDDVPEAGLRHDLLEPSERTSRSPHKGGGLQEDLARGHPEPNGAAGAIAGLICFYDEHGDVDVDVEGGTR